MSENPIFSYTKRDYEGSRREGIAKIPMLSKGVWTDLNSTDPGIIILDYLHALVDMVNYYQDHQALEAFLPTAKERVNIFRLAKQFSYNIRSAKGAVCDVTFTSSLLYDHPIKIPRYTAVRTEGGITYLTTKDAYLPAGGVSVVITCSQGVLSERLYKGTGMSRFSNVSGASNQSVILNAQNIDIDTIRVTDSTGREWSKVDHIVFSTDRDRVYQVDLNPDDTVSIKFGDGERGIVPAENEEFIIEYVITRADEGRVPANSLLVLDSEIIDNGEHIEFSVYNNLASTGGSASQSSEEIKSLAPGVIKAQDRAVTLSDFENLARLIDGVASAKAYDINIIPTMHYNEVKLLIVPENPSDSLEVLRKSVYDYLSKRMIPPTNLIVNTPTYYPVDITIEVIPRDYEDLGALEYNVNQAIGEYFNQRSGAVGETFYPISLSSEVSTLVDVREVISITPQDIVKVDEFSIIVPGQITVLTR